MTRKPTVIFLMGPTASGKTELSLLLAEALNTEIISVDSTLVYRGLDIGSAKPSVSERRGIKHHLIDIRDPADSYSAGEFYEDACKKIENLVVQKKTPLLVGGTMLYFKVLLDGLAELPTANKKIREEIEQRARQKGWPALHQELAQVDSVTADKLHPNHSQRITRALEVYQLTGKPLSDLQRQGSVSDFLSRFRVVQLALEVSDRTLLHQRIAQRFEKMIQLGFQTEVKGLWQRQDLDADLPAIRAVGYRQLWNYFEGEYDLDTAVEKAIVATRQLAKRQMTWLRSWQNLHLLTCDGLYTSEIDQQQRKFTEIRDLALNYVDATTI